MIKHSQKNERTGLEIAVIAVNGRFPGAQTIEAFWDNLKNGVESITFFTEEELKEKGIHPDRIKHPSYVGARGVIKDFDFFDSTFFDYSPIEAELLDPQVRLFHECCWEVLEIAGYTPSAYKGLIGVYIGGTNNRFWEGMAVFSGRTQVLGEFATDHLIDKDFLGTRIAYKLNLKGPAVTMDTACSTGLVAVDFACRGLLTGQCDMALAGAVSIKIMMDPGYIYEEGMINSPDGHCRAFDEKAEGVIFSDGAGVVVLKRLTDAIRDKDTIQAVIKGFAVNNDGVHKSTYTAPSVGGQADVVRTACHMAGVNPETIGYVETHGTGTLLGDPIEIQALTQAYNTQKKGYCAIGSVKTNIGHLDTAAGIAGFIKTVLTIKHGQIPPSLHYKKPNPRIDFKNSPFYVNTQLREWKNEANPLRAGVSSFGVGGTNAHIILEQAPEMDVRNQGDAPVESLLILSARTETALKKTTENLVDYLTEHPEANFSDILYTLQTGRKAFKYKKMMVCTQASEVIDALTSEEPNDELPGVYQFISENHDPTVVFMFTGQGSQYQNMGLELYRHQPLFQEQMDQCFQILEPLMGIDVKGILYPDEFKNSYSGELTINDTRITQPLIFIFEYSLAKLLESWGIYPNTMIGHSIGEYVAACLSGVFTLEDALELVVCRGHMMQQLPQGEMANVRVSEEKLKTLITEFIVSTTRERKYTWTTDSISIAALNGPNHSVVSGKKEVINAFTTWLEKKGQDTRSLHTSHAFHSEMMDSILEPFKEKVSQVTLQKPGLPYISNLTGNWITVEDATSPEYWASHIRKAVRFSQGIDLLLEDDHTIFVEVGPGQALSTFVKKHKDKKPQHKVLNMVRHPRHEESDTRFLLEKVGHLWLYGKQVNWQTFNREGQGKRIQLPSYPFERKRYWIEASPLTNRSANLNPKELQQKKENISEWFYLPSWKPTKTPIYKQNALENEEKENENWLVFTDSVGIGEKLVKKLEQMGHSVVTIEIGDTYTRLADHRYTCAPAKEKCYQELFDELAQIGHTPQRILHLWNVTRAGKGSPKEGFGKIRKTGFYSLVYLAQAIGNQNQEDPLQIQVVTNGMQSVNGNDIQSPEKALVLGPVKIIPMEYPQITCTSIDVQLPQTGTWQEEKLLQQLTGEIANPIKENQILAYRGSHRYIREIEPVRLEKPENQVLSQIKEKGVYLITGGLGGIGLVFTEHLAHQYKARLILTGRIEFPDRSQWDEWLNAHDPYDKISIKINKIKQLEAQGAQVRVFQADVANHAQMHTVVKEAIAEFGHINGVIHAAGVAGGGMIQLKTPEIAEPVISPKFDGTWVLDQLFQEEPLDFMVLCSSVNSVIPLFGQVDYCAANAFLDAYASYKTNNCGVLTVSINWDAWQEVGMAVEASKQWFGAKGEQVVKELKVHHPLLDRGHLDESLQETYTTQFEWNTHWQLKEHRVADIDMGLLPGVTYLEMARAAIDKDKQTHQGITELRDVFFLNPLMLMETETKEAQLVMKKQGSAYEFIIKSRNNPGEEGWNNHAIGKIQQILETGTKEPLFHNLAEIEEKCQEKEIMVPGNEKYFQSGFLLFGPRWGGKKTIKYGKKEALAHFEIPETFSPDFEHYGLHSALLDNATAFLFSHINPKGAYIPLSYKTIKIRKKLPSKVLSYCRFIEDETEDTEFLKFNITLMTEEGEELVDIEEFTMLEVSDKIVSRIKEKQKITSEPFFPVDSAMKDSAFTDTAEAPKEILKNGIRSQEGIEALNRILEQGLPQVIVSTSDLKTRIQQTQASETPLMAKVEPLKPSQALPRPEISTLYAAPKTDLEKKIATLWQELLGMEKVGIHDDFFELGGDSLNIVQLNSRLKRELKREIPVAVLFRYLTISTFARYLLGDQEKEKQKESKKESTSADIRKSRNRLAQRRQKR
jgi:acyl transferase domain-containing protein